MEPVHGAPTLPPSGDGAVASPARGMLIAPSVQPVLHVAAGPDAGVAMEVRDAPVSIGRGRENVLCIADLAMSRKHALIEKTAEGWYLRDLESNNGTLLNGVRVHSAFLAEGDVIGVGDTQIVVERPGKEPQVPAGVPLHEPGTHEADATRPKVAPRVSATRLLWPYWVAAVVIAAVVAALVAWLSARDRAATQELARAQVEQGLVLMARGDWSSAADHFRVALKLDPGSEVARRNLGRAQGEANCATLVSPSLALAGEAELKSSYDALAGVASTCAGSKAFTAARARIEQALESAVSEAARLKAAGDAAAAAALLDKVLAAVPDHPAAKALRAEIPP